MKKRKGPKKPRKIIKKASKKRGYVVLGLIAILGSLFLFGFIPRFFQTLKINQIAAEDPLPKVLILTAHPDEKPITFGLPSSTQAHHITPIWARTNGYLKSYLADIGDVVKEGQLLAEIETPEVDEQYRQSVADLASAQAKRDIAKITSDRYQALYKADASSVAKQDVDDKVAAYLTAEADLVAAEANMLHFKDLVDFKYIKAPFDGIIIERTVDLGSLISAGSNGSPQRLFVIAQTDIIRVFVSVPQYFFRSIHEGVKGIARIKEFPDDSFPCTVARFAKALDPVSRTMLTELHIDNKEGKILAGLFTDVTFEFTPETPYYTVPMRAVIIRAGEPQVAVIDEKNVVHLKTVKIGVDYGKEMQIIGGIEPNDRIVINPTENIQDGVSVEVEA